MIGYVHQGVFERKRAGVGDRVRGGERGVDWGIAEERMDVVQEGKNQVLRQQSIDLERGLQIWADERMKFEGDGVDEVNSLIEILRE